MIKRCPAFLLAAVLSFSAFHSVSAVDSDGQVKETYTIQEAAQGFIDSVEPDKALTAGETVPILDEDELLSGFCVSLYAGEKPSGYVVIKNTTDGPRVSEFVTESGVENLYAQLMNRPAAKEIQKQEAEPGVQQADAAQESKKVIYSFDALDYKVAAGGDADGEQAVFVDYDNQMLTKQELKAAKASAKEQKKLAKEEKKQRKEQLKALKKAKKAQEKADKQAAKKASYAGREIDLSQVTTEQIEEAEQELDAQVEPVPFAQSRMAVDEKGGVISYHEFHNLNVPTISSGYLDNVYTYDIVTESYIEKQTKKFACAVVAMTNTFSWLKTNGYRRALRNDSLVDTFNTLWDYSKTWKKDEYNNITYGSTFFLNYGSAMNQFAAEQGYTGSSFDGYALNLFSDYQRDIRKNLPCMFGYIANEIEQDTNDVTLFGFDHVVSVTGFIETTKHKFLYVATGWDFNTNVNQNVIDKEDGPTAERVDSYLFYHRYLDLNQHFWWKYGGAFHINNSPDYK